MLQTAKIELSPGSPITPLRITCEGGTLVRVIGRTGRTQDEEDVPLFGLREGKADLPFFIWSHYYSILALVEGTGKSRLHLEQGENSVSLAFGDIGICPAEVKLGASRLLIALLPKESGLHAEVSPCRVRAGENVSFDVLFTIGPEGIAEGGTIRLFTPVTCWSPAVLNSDSLRLESATEARIEGILVPDAFGTRGPMLHIRVTRGRLHPGDRIRFRYAGENGGIRVQTYPAEKVYLRVLVDSEGIGNPYPLPLDRTPSVTVVPGSPSRLRMACPMIVQAGEPFDLRLVALDDCYNPVGEAYSGSIRVLLNKNELLSEGCMEKYDRGTLSFEGLTIEREGLHCIQVWADGLDPATLCVKVAREAPKERLYWGAIHGHSSVSDGEGTVDEYYRYGRDVGLVDVCSLTDHAWEIALHARNEAMGRFRGIVEAARKYHKEGRYVTIPAYEWMGTTGHINIYFLEEEPDAPVYVDAILGNQECDTVTKIFERYRGKKAFIIPHASHGMNWDSFDEELEPVLEMYSMWGSSEYKCCNPGGANDGLARGYRFGFLAGADSHHGNPGQTGKSSRYKMLHSREGLAAFRAERLTREAIFSAIRGRATYATTGERIYLEFSINGRPMGSELRVRPGEKMTLSAIVGGTAPITKIECIRNGVPADIQPKEGNDLVREEVWTDRADTREGAIRSFYLRITQADGEMAWSSPIWIETT